MTVWLPTMSAESSMWRDHAQVDRCAVVAAVDGELHRAVTVEDAGTHRQVAVKMMFWPKLAGLSDEVTVVLVLPEVNLLSTQREYRCCLLLKSLVAAVAAGDSVAADRERGVADGGVAAAEAHRCAEVAAVDGELHRAVIIEHAGTRRHGRGEDHILAEVGRVERRCYRRAGTARVHHLIARERAAAAAEFAVAAIRRRDRIAATVSAESPIVA